MKKVLFVLLFAVLMIGGIVIMSSKAALHGPTKAIQLTFTPSPALIPTPSKTPEMVCIVTADALNIRQCAGVRCVVVGSVKRAETVNIARFVGSWAEILPAGFVNSAFLTCGGVK